MPGNPGATASNRNKPKVSTLLPSLRFRICLTSLGCYPLNLETSFRQRGMFALNAVQLFFFDFEFSTFGSFCSGSASSLKLA